MLVKDGTATRANFQNVLNFVRIIRASQSPPLPAAQELSFRYIISTHV